METFNQIREAAFIEADTMLDSADIDVSSSPEL